MEFLSNYYLIIIFLILIGYEYRHKPFIKNNFSITKTWFRVDSRALGIYRILLGWLCCWVIFRRWDYIDVFYSNLGIPTHKNNYFGRQFVR